jgi:hypothetical protein
MAVAAGLALYAQDRRDRARDSRAHAEMAALSASVAELRQRGSAGDDGRRPPRRTHGRTAGPTADEAAAYHELVFQQEATDPAWGPEAAGSVSARLHELLEDPARLRSVECRTSLCKVEVSVDRDEDADPISKRLGESLGFWDGQSSFFRAKDAGGKPAMRAYLVRKGHARPTPPKG